MRRSLAARISSGSKFVFTASDSSHPSSQPNRFSFVTSAWFRDLDLVPADLRL
jgi:hypothetical protein